MNTKARCNILCYLEFTRNTNPVEWHKVRVFPSGESREGDQTCWPQWTSSFFLFESSSFSSFWLTFLFNLFCYWRFSCTLLYPKEEDESFLAHWSQAIVFILLFFSLVLISVSPFLYPTKLYTFMKDPRTLHLQIQSLSIDLLALPGRRKHRGSLFFWKTKALKCTSQVLHVTHICLTWRSFSGRKLSSKCQLSILLLLSCGNWTSSSPSALAFRVTEEIVHPLKAST